MIELNTLYNESCLDTMKRMDDNSINLVMTSPPYWALRDYGTGSNQLGLEPTFDLYIQHLCDIFDEVKRVLRNDGTCWVNMGDTYGGTTGQPNAPKLNPQQVYEHKSASRIKEYCPSKSLIMIPFRFAIEMVGRGWILRNTIIWHKRNCMPSSVKDRFTVDFEYLFFFSKNKKYYFEQQFDKHLTQELRPDGIVRNREYGYDSKLNAMNKKKYSLRGKRGGNKNPDYRNLQGRNKRTVWTINPMPFSEAHFAVYPEELCEIPIKAGCPEFVCKKCGKPREKIIEAEGGTIGRSWHNHKDDMRVGQRAENKAKGGHGYKRIDKGYTNCNCNVGFEGGIVYDPFAGSGTTGLVAHRLNRNYILSEIKKEYCEIAEKRLQITKQIQFV